MCQAMDEIKQEWKQEGIKKGKQEGIKEGEKKGREAVALSLLKLGTLTRTAIAKLTKLPYATVKKLAESM